MDIAGIYTVTINGLMESEPFYASRGSSACRKAVHSLSKEAFDTVCFTGRPVRVVGPNGAIQAFAIEDLESSRVFHVVEICL